MLGRKLHYQRYCPTMTWRTSIMLTNLGYSKDAWQTKHFNSNQKSIQSGKLVCITSIAAADTVGDKIPMFVIRKSQKPSCIKNVNFLPCRYWHQRKSWRNGVLFEEYVRELDQYFSLEGRSVALVVGSCPSHSHIESLKSIKLFFLPPSTTSTTQAMDQGVIRSLKAKCRKNMAQKIIRS